MAKWYNIKDKLPEGNIMEGIIVNTLPVPKTCVYGIYDDNGGKSVGFHDCDYGKCKSHKVELWSYFDFPLNYINKI